MEQWNDDRHEERVQELRDWNNQRQSNVFLRFVRRVLSRGKVNFRKPNAHELKECALHYFPPRSNLNVFVCDFRDNDIQVRMIRFSEVEGGMSCRYDNIKLLTYNL